MHRRIATAFGALVLATALSGCTGAQTTYADLERDQEDADILSASMIGADDGAFTIDGDSTRLVAVRGDTEIFLASATEQGHERICILVLAETEPLRACGSDGFGMSDTVNEYRVLSDAVADTQLDPDEGWTRLSENVFTRPVVDETADTQ